MSKSGHRWDEKVDPSITDGVKLPLINALDGVRIESHLAPRHDLLLLCHLDHPLTEVLNPFRSLGQRSLVHHRVIGNLTGTYSRESAVDRIGAHLALHHFVASVAHVLQPSRPRVRRFGRRLARASYTVVSNCSSLSH